MPTLTIGDQKVKVGDDFLSLSPEQQSATVEEIASSLGAAPAMTSAPSAAAITAPVSPPVTQERPAEVGLLQSVREAIHGPTRLLENGMSFGLADRARAGIGALIGDGTYGANLADEQKQTDQYRSEHPVIAPIAEGVGGVAVPLGAIGAASRAAGLGTKMLLGGGAGAGIGGIQGAAGSRDWTNLPQAAKDAAIGSGIGFVVGGTLPAAGKIIGAGYNAAANALRGNADGISRGASRHLVEALAADNPEAVQARLTQLGDQAMLADAGPAFLGKAQGASLNNDEGRSVLQNALTARNEGTNQRIMGDVNRALGPAEDPQTVTDSIRRWRQEVDARNYPAALDNAPPVQTAPILQNLEDMIPRSVGMEKKALTNLRDMMMQPERRQVVDASGYPVFDGLGHPKFQDVKVSQNDAGVLHKIKQELDNVIEYDAPGLGLPASALSRQQGSLKYFRGQLNDALEQQVPGYLNANRQSAALARRADAVEAGTQYLGSGKTIASPGRFAAEFENMPLGEQIALAKGSRGSIERALGTKANDLQALRQELQGEGGWNTAKLATVHGQDAADQLIGSVDRNLKFRDTYNKVVENSQTAQRQAAKEAMRPTPSSETPLFDPRTTGVGFMLGGGKRLLSAGYNAVRPDTTRSFGEVANVLTAQGPERDKRLLAIVDALNKRKTNAVASPIVGDISSLLAAIAANGYARTGPMRSRER
jgi:hypothetical protein